MSERYERRAAIQTAELGSASSGTSTEKMDGRCGRVILEKVSRTDWKVEKAAAKNEMFLAPESSSTELVD